nr:hypothetical protein Iba_chr05dCG12310 [Ipomoea batatas]
MGLMTVVNNIDLQFLAAAELIIGGAMMLMDCFGVDLSDLELLELLSEKIADVLTRILEVPFAYEYSPELLPHWMENVPY